MATKTKPTLANDDVRTELLILRNRLDGTLHGSRVGYAIDRTNEAGVHQALVRDELTRAEAIAKGLR